MIRDCGHAAAAGRRTLRQPAGEAVRSCGFIIGAVAGPLQASSRSLLARLVPAEAAGCYFGLLAFSGNLTSLLPSLLVAIATEATGVQGAGLVALIAFFSVGAMLLSGVRRA